MFISLVVLVVSGLNDYLSEKWDQEFALSAIILAIAVFTTMLTLLSGLKYPNNRHARMFVSIFLLYLLLASISTFLNPANDQLFWGFRYYLPSLVIYTAGFFGFTYWARRESFLSMVNILRLSFILNTFTVVFGYFFDMDIFIVRGDRASGINLNANDAGYIGVLALSFELFYGLRVKSRSFWVVLPIIILGIFFTFSKSAYLMAIIIFVLYGYYSFRNNYLFNKVSRLTTVLLIFGLVGYYLVGVSSDLTFRQKDRISQFTGLLSGEISEQTTTNRSSLAAIGWQKIIDAPVLGHGFGSMSKMGTFTGGVHNQYMLLWGEGGFIAMLAFIGLLISYYRWSYKLDYDYRFLIRSILFTIAIFSLTSHNIYSQKSIVLILSFVAIMLNMNRLKLSIRHVDPKYNSNSR